MDCPCNSCQTITADLMALSRSLDEAIREENQHAIDGTEPDRSLLEDFLATPIEEVLSPESLAIVRARTRAIHPRGRGKGRRVRALEALGS